MGDGQTTSNDCWRTVDFREDERREKRRCLSEGAIVAFMAAAKGDVLFSDLDVEQDEEGFLVGIRVKEEADV